jgi:signal transduction histidine kinase
MIAWLLGPARDGRTYRELGFLLAGLPLGIAAFVVLVTGWSLVLGLAIVTPVAVVVLIALRLLVGGFARVEGFLARELLGTATRPVLGRSGGGLWRRGLNILVGPEFWKQQAYLFLRFVLGLPMAVVELALIGLALQALAAPITYRWEDLELGLRTVDSLGEALLVVPFAPVALLLMLHLVHPFAAAWRPLASRLLAGEPGAVPVKPLTPAQRIAALVAHAAITAGVSLLLVAIWALTGAGYFWPVWAILPLALVLAVHGWIVLVLLRPEVRRFFAGSTALALSVGVAASIGAFLVGIWAVTAPGYFWPMWALLGLGIAVVILAAGIFVAHVSGRAHRIEELETTRAGAIDVQESELRRIERDLHDGAQARLVALGMSIGMAEEKLRTDPDAAAQLLSEARSDARQALQELRDLARGIRPPILTDRGLGAAIDALVARSPVPVTVSVDVSTRPPDAVETAAYFVVAEALANAIKHADATRVEITVARSDGRLLAQVVDDGRGGADPEGYGLTGLSQRVRALDGSLRVASPPGGPTTVRAELPCA